MPSPSMRTAFSSTWDAEAADAIVSTAALYLLPDFWKLVALKRMNGMLKAGGRFFLLDVVFSFPVENHEKALDKWLSAMNQMSGGKMMQEASVHI
ncbi:MAG: hypothetical protein JW969_10020 [Spirochaetales bacterium]|nr:hypothetical protein [Spirochaetales bacterium]